MRIKEKIQVLVLLSLLYSLLLLFIALENIAALFFLLALASGGGYYLTKFQKGVVSSIQQLFARNRKWASGITWLLLFTFPFFQTANPYWIHVGVMTGLFVIMALGLNIMVGYAGLACLGYAAFYAIGAYTSALLTVNYHVSFWLTLPLSGLMAMIFGLLLGLPALRVKGHYLALVTIAFGLVVQQLLINLEGLTGGTDGIVNIPPPTIGGFSLLHPLNLGFIELPFQANFYFLALILVALTLYICVSLSHSLVGLGWNAIREDQLAAQCYGINLTKNKLWAFAAGAFFGGLAGAVYSGMVGFISPENFTYTHSILVLSMLLLGGIDSLPGIILGAVLLTVLPEKFRSFEDYRMLFYGLVIVLMLIFKPDGLIPSRQRKYTLANEEPTDNHGVVESKFIFSRN